VIKIAVLRFALVAIAFACVLVPGPSYAGAKYLLKDFAFETEAKPQVLVVRPDIFVGSHDSEGREVVVPDWLEASHTNLQAALLRHPSANDVEYRFADWNGPDSKPLSAGLWEELGALNSDLLVKTPQGTFPIPPGEDWQQVIKSVERGYHEYTLAQRWRDEVTAAEGEADFALFVHMRDAYSTSGAMLARLLGGMANVINDGVNTAQGPPHYGFAILVDMRDGRVIWYYNDGAFGGDLRKDKPADKRVRQLLKRFPAGR
jgi:hypothetical protein